jgi:hypothetical protein
MRFASCLLAAFVLVSSRAASADCDPCDLGARPRSEGVPTNTHFWIALERNWTITDDPGYFAVDTFDVGPVPEGAWPYDALDTLYGRLNGALVASTFAEVEGCSLGTGIIELAPPEPLPPETHHGYVYASGDSSLHEGTFTTGASPDSAAPVFAGIGVVKVEEIRCTFEDGHVETRIRASATGDGAASDDASVPSFRLSVDGTVVAASFDSQVSAILPDFGGEHCFSMQAVDGAGNVGANDGVVCLGPEDVTEGAAYELRDEPWYNVWTEVPRESASESASESGSSGSGCHVAPGAISGAVEVWLLVLGLAGLRRSSRLPRDPAREAP